MDRVAGGLFWTAVLNFFPALARMIFAGIGTGLVWFICLGFVGYFVLVFTGSDAPQKGPVPYEEVQVFATGTLDNFTLTARNLNSAHKITLLEMDCAGANVLLRNIEPGDTAHYAAYKPNIMRGSIQCEILRVHS